MRRTRGLVQEWVGPCACLLGNGRVPWHQWLRKRGLAGQYGVELAPQLITDVVKRCLGAVVLDMAMVIMVVRDTLLMVMQMRNARIGQHALHVASPHRTLQRQDEHEQPKEKIPDHALNHRTSDQLLNEAGWLGTSTWIWQMVSMRLRRVSGVPEESADGVHNFPFHDGFVQPNALSDQALCDPAVHDGVDHAGGGVQPFRRQ